MKGGISHSICGYIKANDKNKESSCLRSLCLMLFFFFFQQNHSPSKIMKNAFNFIEKLFFVLIFCIFICPPFFTLSAIAAEDDQR